MSLNNPFCKAAVFGGWLALGTGLAFKYLTFNIKTFGICSVGFLFFAFLKKHFNGGVNKYTKTDLSGKTIVITGANTGLGYICAEEMAKLNAEKIILACRNETRG